jgi:predicted GNAT family N-acyltransferase
MHVFGSGDDPGMAASRQLRDEVFCREQGVPAHLEWDGKDREAVHFLLYANDRPIATARARRVGATTFKIERMAVKKSERRGGAGRTLLLFVLYSLRRITGPETTFTLHAQRAVEDFYVKLGFISRGSPFEEAGIDHVAMVLMPAARTQPPQAGASC